MKPEDVPAELVDAGYAAMLDAGYRVVEDMGDQVPEDQAVRLVLAAVLPSARLSVLEELRAEIATWRPYDTRDIGDAFLADSVVDLVADRIDDIVRKEATHG